MIRDFNDAARVEEQKEINGIKHDYYRQAVLTDIRQKTEAYLRDKDGTERAFSDTAQERFSARYTELVKEQGLHADFMPPGTRKNLEAAARADIQNAHQADLSTLKLSHETQVRQRIDQSVRLDGLEQRADQFRADRDAWVGQRSNVVEHVSRAENAAEKQRYEQVLECLDRGWAQTIDRHYDMSRERGIAPEFSRTAHDVGRSR